MNGAESLISTLSAGGIETCFTNPGTSELHIVAALDRTSQMRCVLGLFEGVVTGAADGYARMAGKPACTLLHLGPGLANGLANLHNARRAQVPLVNIVGQHATYHLHCDTPLSSDIEAIAAPHSKWMRTSRASSEVGRDAAEAIVAARTAPGNIATLIVPADIAWSDGGVMGAIPPIPRVPMPKKDRIERAAAMLRSSVPTAMVIAGSALYGQGLLAAGQIATATGAKLFAPYNFMRIERGAGLPVVERVHYVVEQALEQLKEFRKLILVGAAAPVAYFAYPDKSSVLTSPECEIHSLANPEEDVPGALNLLEEAICRRHGAFSGARPQRPPVPIGDMTLPRIATAIAALLPDNVIVVDESMTSGRQLMSATAGLPAHDWLANTGGAIGIAMPLAVGAAVASPDRRVLCLSADGSGMYTAQALWTMARESLKITSVIFANRIYAVLKREFSTFGLGEPGPHARDLMEIGHPELDWVQLAKGMGVPGTSVSSLDCLIKALQRGFEADGPTLIEVTL